MYRIELTKSQRTGLLILLTGKLKEIHAWRAATKSQVRDEQYDKIATLLKIVRAAKEGE